MLRASNKASTKLSATGVDQKAKGTTHLMATTGPRTNSSDPGQTRSVSQRPGTTTKGKTRRRWATVWSSACSSSSESSRDGGRCTPSSPWNPHLPVSHQLGLHRSFTLIHGAGGTWPSIAVLFSRMFGTFQLQGSEARSEGNFWALMVRASRLSTQRSPLANLVSSVLRRRDWQPHRILLDWSHLQQHRSGNASITPTGPAVLLIVHCSV